MRKILEIENLSKSFISGDVEFQALKNINLTLIKGSV